MPGRETLHVSPSVPTSKSVFQHLIGELWSLKLKLQQVAARPPLPFLPSPDSFALFSRQLIYMSFFLLLPLALHSAIQSAVV